MSQLALIVTLLACTSEDRGSASPSSSSGSGAEGGASAGVATGAGGSAGGSSGAGSGGQVAGSGGSPDAGGVGGPGGTGGAALGGAAAGGSDGGAGGAELVLDPFGVRELYPTLEGGREWFLDMVDPMGDGQFTSVPDTIQPTANADGTWRISRELDAPNNGVRLNVETPAGFANWLNIEMTGYVKLVSSSFPEEFAWRTTSGTPHSNACDGYAYYGLLKFDGSNARFSKEVWHNQGYVASPASSDGPTEALLDRWAGLKMVRYNINDDTEVKLELWLDNQSDNTWVKVLEDIDTGWATPNPFPDGSDCMNPLTGELKTLDVIMTWPYPLVTYRADNATFDFKNFSVREIAPP